MKKLPLLLCALIMAGCASSMPQKANINPVVDDQPNNVYQAGIDISINGVDTRNGAQIIKVALPEKPVVLIPNQIAPEIVLTERLQNGFQQQGLANGGLSNVTIAVTIEDLQSTLTKPGVMFNITTNSRIKLTVSNNGNNLNKEYNRSSTKETLTRPDIHDMEVQINEQLSDIMAQALSDNQIRGAIKGQF